MEEQLYYGDYLALDEILNAQRPESARRGTMAHDEMLFIITHQTYELWFKQILWELDALLRIFRDDTVEERDVGRAVAHLERIVRIQRVLLQHVEVLETMTPLDFLDFRNLLVPASGFQSVQFRLIENKMGLRLLDRRAAGGGHYTERFREEDRNTLREAEAERSLHDLTEEWLERTPFLTFGKFDFWTEYGSAVNSMLAEEERLIKANPTLTPSLRQRQLESLTSTRARFAALFDPAEYEALRKAGEVRLSRKALTAALLINLYRDEPILRLPFRYLTLLLDVDENFASWRHRHALMALRMIGSKIGTGGSSGHEYLRKSADHSRVFKDLFGLATLLIPRSAIPALPDDVRSRMGFRY